MGAQNSRKGKWLYISHADHPHPRNGCKYCWLGSCMFWQSGIAGAETATEAKLPSLLLYPADQNKTQFQSVENCFYDWFVIVTNYTTYRQQWSKRLPTIPNCIQGGVRKVLMCCFFVIDTLIRTHLMRKTKQFYIHLPTFDWRKKNLTVNVRGASALGQGLFVNSESWWNASGWKQR